MLMLSGPVELLFLLFLIAVCTCSVVMFICVGCSLLYVVSCNIPLLLSRISLKTAHATLDFQDLHF